MARRDTKFEEPSDDDDEVIDEASALQESDEAYCPDCGALIWDTADVCPKCFSYLGGDTARHPPNRRARRSVFSRIVVLLVIVGLLLTTGIAVLLRALLR